MRKIVYGALLIMALMGTLTGCGSKETDKNENSQQTNTTAEDVKDKEDNETTEADSAESDAPSVEYDVKMIADALLNGVSFKDSLAAVDNTMALTRLYVLDESMIEQAMFYTNSNATAEEIAVIKAKSEDYVATIQTAYETRIANQKEACKDYLPDEMPKLDSAVIYTKGNYVVLCISNDNEAAQNMLEDLFK